MLKLLVAVDGSDASRKSVDHLLKVIARQKDATEIHLLNVQPPVSSLVSAQVGHDALKKHHHDEGMAALKPAMQKLDAAGVKYVHHIAVGEAAELIIRFAKEKGCDEIVIGAHGVGSTASLLLGSVATKVIHLAEIPVLLVK
jgi:nucleotide-binding universal stress UspA family protein